MGVLNCDSTTDKTLPLHWIIYGANAASCPDVCRGRTAQRQE